VPSPRSRRFVRVAAGALLAAVVATTSSALRANESGAVVVTSTSSVELRVQVAEGLTAPCDSGNNRMLLDGRLPPGATFRATIAGDCVCIRSTSASFPNSDWTPSGLKCRPRICRGRVCRPAPDPTIYVSVP
jgi:hypothetical protein